MASSAPGAILISSLILFGSMAAEGQPRLPVRRTDPSPAHLVRDIEPGSDAREFSMGTPVHLGNALIAWSLTNPNSCYPYLWRVDPAEGRSTLLKEISPSYDPNWWPEPMILQAGRLYFSARVPGEYATHLWTTDGTPQGTQPVVGPGGIGFDYPAALMSSDGYLYFFAETSAEPSQAHLWRSDGTAAGTARIGEVRGLPHQCVGWEGGGACGTSEPPITKLKERMIFAGLSPRYPSPPYALFSSDAVGGQTEVLLEFDYSVPDFVEKVGDIGYFRVGDIYQVHGAQLWRTDGTRTGTWLVKDLCPRWCRSYIWYPKADGNRLFFFASQDAQSGLWKSDGTEAGTIRLADVWSQTGEYLSAGGLLFFIGWDKEHGNELWRTDGTREGTFLLKDIRPGSDGSVGGRMVFAGRSLFFYADDGVHGPALWRTDGSSDGTILLKETGQARPSSVFHPLVPFGGSVFFSAEDAEHGRELWKSDGTVEGTHLVADVFPGSGSSEPFVIPGPELRLRFLARGPEGVSLWDTDGSSEGTRRLARIDSGAESRSSNPSLLNDVDGSLFFFTRPPCGCSLTELWESDGTGEGTAAVEALQPASTAVSAGGNLYFSDSTVGTNGTYTFRFNRVDGRSRARTVLADLPARNLIAVDETVFFETDGALWRTDAARADVVKVKDLWAYQLAGSGGALYVQTGGDDASLWKSDGTETGTVRVHPGAVAHLTDAGGVLYYVSLYEPGGSSLRYTSANRSDSTLVRRFPTETPRDPIVDTAGGRNLLFFVFQETTGTQLWRSDGTEAGTYRLSEIPASGPLVSDGTGVYFIGFDPAHGYELWHSFGTPESTARVKDIQPGPGSSLPKEMRLVDGVLLFSADDGAHGREIWQSDGTDEGTQLLGDICPGACSSDPALFTQSGQNVFFRADDGDTGEELWSLPLSAIHPRRKSGARAPARSVAD